MVALKQVDGNHLRVDGCFPQEIDDMIECMMWIGKKYILLPYHFKQALLASEVRMLHRRSRLIEQMGTAYLRKRDEILDVVVTSTGSQLLRLTELHLPDDEG